MNRFVRAPALLLAFASAWACPAAAQGTLPGLTMAQQVDANGKPLVGCLLYLYVTGTISQQQLAYHDTGLTQPWPWPLTCDGFGRLPAFYVANGSIAFNLTDANGAQQASNPSVLVVGPSGGGGGGSGVDATTIASTGDVKFRPVQTSLSGWVRLNGLTIGSAVSGASERANADTQSLFVSLWTGCDNTHCPVPGGRGANALADFSANKQITLPDWRARSPMGVDDMGNSAAGQFAGVPFSGSDTATTGGGLAGENTHTLSVTEMPAHNHTITDPGHTHTYSVAGGPTAFAGAAVNALTSLSTVSTGSSTTGITINNAGGGGAHNNVSRVVLGTWFMKL